MSFHKDSFLQREFLRVLSQLIWTHKPRALSSQAAAGKTGAQRMKWLPKVNVLVNSSSNKIHIIFVCLIQLPFCYVALLPYR